MRLTIALVLTAVMFPLHRAGYAIDLRSPRTVARRARTGAAGRLRARDDGAADDRGAPDAGTVIAQQLGLGFVTAVDPSQGQQGLLVGNFLTLLGVTLIFATDLHHLVIAGCMTATGCSSPARCRR